MDRGPRGAPASFYRVLFATCRRVRQLPVGSSSETVRNRSPSGLGSRPSASAALRVPHIAEGV
jgi:hypothetical protein